MISDYFHYFLAVHIFVAGFLGVKVIGAAAGGIPAGQGVSCGVIGGFGYRLVKLAVCDCGKFAVLIYHPLKSVGEGGVLYSVADNRSDSHLSHIAFPSAFGGNDSCQQIYVGVGGVGLLTYGYSHFL